MAKTLAWVLGVVFVLVAILGFVNSPIVGQDGYFHTNTLHDVFHLVTGLIFIFIGWSAPAKAGTAFKVFGVIYLILAVLGFVVAPSGPDMFGVAVNMADHWLHIVLGVVILALGFMVGKRDMVASNPMM
jgi:hypothetical protein